MLWGNLLLDGRGRLDAMEIVGMTVVGEPGHDEGCPLGGDLHAWEIIILNEKSLANEPYAYVISANIHRRHLTAEQKRELIAALLKAAPERSNLATAKIAKVSDKTVARVRDRLETTSEFPKLTKRVGLDGRARSSARRPAKREPGDEVVRRPPVQLVSKSTRTPVFEPLERALRKARAQQYLRDRPSGRKDGVAEGAAELDDSLTVEPSQSSDDLIADILAAFRKLDDPDECIDAISKQISMLDLDDMPQLLTGLDAPHFAAIRTFFDTKLSG